MAHRRVRNFLSVIAICAALLSLTDGAYAQTLDSKLEQQTDYAPQSSSPLDQLTEIAQKFRLPMAIEWLELPGSVSETSAAIVPQRRTVRELLHSVVEQCPEHRLTVEEDVAHVYAPAVVSHPFNFLNMRLRSFSVTGADLFEAESWLSTAINLTLYPELFRGGYGGGYGHPPNHVFTIPNITFSGRNMSIREILNRIAAGNGNALRVVKLKREEFVGVKPHWKGKPLDEYGHSPINYRWHFTPLADVAELASEQIICEISAEGFPEPGKVIIPVITEHNPSGEAGGHTVMVMGGQYFDYAVVVSEVQKDAVVVNVKVTTKAADETEKSIDAPVLVPRGASPNCASITASKSKLILSRVRAEGEWPAREWGVKFELLSYYEYRAEL